MEKVKIFDRDFYSLKPPQRFSLLFPRLSHAQVNADQDHQHRQHDISYRTSAIAASSHILAMVTSSREVLTHVRQS